MKAALGVLIRGAVAACTALLIASPPTAAEPAVVHVPPDLFGAGGPLGALRIEECRIVLADGPGGAVLRVSPAMAGMGFRDIPFAVPPLEQEIAFGPLSTTLRLRIPGRDPSDPSATIQSSRVTMRIRGAAIELTGAFESRGPELIAEYYASDPRTGEDGWVHALDVEANDLTVKVVFPIRSAGAALALGSPAVNADFSFAVAGRGFAGLALDGTFAKDAVKSALEKAVARALDLEAYRAPLAAAVTTWLREGPFSGLNVREIRVLPAADGGLDLQAVSAP